MHIFIRGEDETKTLEVEANTTLASLQEAMGGSVVLSYGGRPLEGSDLTLVEAGVGELATLEATRRLLGGKVHGSLARAGKVKGQTPKVDKQEKKKKKTGRAKRRIQYNRRFVNVVALPGGRKKGPNSNS